MTLFIGSDDPICEPRASSSNVAREAGSGSGRTRALQRSRVPFSSRTSDSNGSELVSGRSITIEPSYGPTEGLPPSCGPNLLPFAHSGFLRHLKARGTRDGRVREAVPDWGPICYVPRMAKTRSRPGIQLP